MAIEINIAGDFVVEDEFSTVNLLDNSILDHFANSDLNIVNLEAPITSNLRKNRIQKTGPHLRGSEDVVGPLLTKLNINLVTLANNHILDYGERGLQDTLKFCRNRDIDTVGAGINLQEAQAPFFKEINGLTIAVLNFAENEWCNSTSQSAGANPMDLIDNINQIRETKKNSDVVLVIVHGGNEYNHYPSPRMVKQYRFYAENGADAVIGHHTHCVSGYERHNGVPILYSLGNFLFTTKKKKLDSWYKGFVVKLYIDRGDPIKFDIIPICQNNGSHFLSIMDDTGKGEVLRTIEEVNKAILNEQLLHDKWVQFVNKVEQSFVKSLTPIAGVENAKLRGALYRLGVHRFFLNKLYLKEHLNRIRCESHYDVVKDVLAKYLKS
jgi:hypothetical protein